MVETDGSAIHLGGPARGVPVGAAGDQGDAGEDPEEGAAGMTCEKTAFINQISFRSCNLALFQKTHIFIQFQNGRTCPCVQATLHAVGLEHGREARERGAGAQWGPPHCQ